MKEKKSQLTFEHLHAKPITRRDLLASGLLPFSASFAMAPLMAFFAKAGVAEAQEGCQSLVSLDLCPIVTLNLSGGAALAANFVPHDQGRQLLPSYSKMGLGTGSAVSLDREFANQAPFSATSGVLRGLRTSAAATTLAASTFVGVCVRSQDDSAMNKFDVSGLALKAGMKGKFLPNLGVSNTDTGIRQAFALVRPSAPLVVKRYEDILGALGISGSLAALNSDQKIRLFASVKKLSESQSAKIMDLSGGALLARLMGCAQGDNSALIADSGSLDTDPLKNPAFATAWNITNNTSKSSQDFVFASLVYNLLKGNSGPVSLEMGGYDYHDGTRTSGDTKDQAAGVVMGKILQSFAILGVKGYLVVTSDGSVSSAESDVGGAPWMSDRGTAGSAYMMSYDPAGAHMTKSFQLGQYTSGQGADDQFITGGVPEMAAAGIFANYLSFNKRTNLIETLMPRTFTTADLDKVLVVG